MASLRFSGDALAQLQQAYDELATSGSRRAIYDAIVATLAHLERDAALFTLLEASPLPAAPNQTYAVAVTVGETQTVDIAYQLSAADEDVVLWSIRWQPG